MAIKTKRRLTKKNTKSLPSSSKSRRSKSPVRSLNRIEPDENLETALRYLREGRSQKRAAEIGMVPVKRFRRFLRSNKLAKFTNGRWRITDRRIREIVVISEGRETQIKVRGFNPASLSMRHRAAVQHFLDSNDATLLLPFKELTVTDTSKQKHVLETRPNVLLRLANTGSDAEMKIYRLID